MPHADRLELNPGSILAYWCKIGFPTAPQPRPIIGRPNGRTHSTKISLRCPTMRWGACASTGFLFQFHMANLRCALMERCSNFLGGNRWMLSSSYANSWPPIKADAAEPPPVPMLGKWLLLGAPCNWSWILNDELRCIKSWMWRTYSPLRHWRSRVQRFQIPSASKHGTPHIIPQTQWSFVDLAPSQEMWKSQGRCALDSRRSRSPIVGCGPWMPARLNSSPKGRRDRRDSQLILQLNLAILGRIPSSRECLFRTARFLAHTKHSSTFYNKEKWIYQTRGPIMQFIQYNKY